jgi:hypothetical protein
MQDHPLATLASFPPGNISSLGDKEVESAIQGYTTWLQGQGSELKETVLQQPEQALQVAIDTQTSPSPSASWQRIPLLTKVSQLLDPSTNSIGYLAVLDILSNAVDYSSSSPTAAANHVRNAIVSFLLKFDPRQVRYVGSTLLKLLERVGSGKLFPVCKPEGRRNTRDDVLTPRSPPLPLSFWRVQYSESIPPALCSPRPIYCWQN